MWAMVAKEFRQLRRDRRTVAMMIVLPVVLLIVFGYAANFSVRNIPTVVVGPGAAKERTGYVPASAGLYGDLTVQENLDFSAEAYRLPAAERGPREAEILERTGLAGARGRLGGHLSGGMQRKLAVGMALLHSPEMLVLDEPTTGVDPVSRAGLWRLISGAAARGTAVAVATTYVNEAARASSVVLLEAGQVLASGSPGAILRAGFHTRPGGSAGV